MKRTPPSRDLNAYQAKRTFTRTPEPTPELNHRAGPLLFVVQKHAARRLHYDFRLELDGVLKSWAVPKGPSLDPNERRTAAETEDHPFAYAAFEGVIPTGEYGAGKVIVWDCGVYSPDEGQRYAFHDRDDAQMRIRTALAAGKLSFFLRGEKLKGSFTLVRTRQASQWLLIKHRDHFVDTTDALLARAESVLSGATLDSIDRDHERFDAALLTPGGPLEKLPARLAPMLAEVGERVHTDASWAYEPKLDGYRVIALLERGTVRLISRGGLELTHAFPEVTEALAAQCVESMALDGEIVALSADGRPSFNALQKRAQLKSASDIDNARRARPVALVCFDLLHFAGVNVRNQRYIDRRRYLVQCLLPSPALQLMHAASDGEALYDAALASGFEGVMAKRKDSVYQPGRRSAAWLKIKAVQTAEFVVGGYTKGKGAREAIGALLLGQWDEDGLQYVGHAGSGLHDEVIATLLPRLESLERRTSPFASKPRLHRPTIWLAPELVVEVSYQERTPDGMLRAPVFLRLRDDVRVGAGSPRTLNTAQKPVDAVADVLAQLDIRAKQLTLEVGGARIRLSNLDREYWPAVGKEPPITKGEFIRYLAQVSPHMLPHLRDRPLTMIRMPEGIAGERFYQKHWEQKLPEFVETITVYSDHKADQHDYLLANNLATLLWLGQVGTLEFHIWHSRAQPGDDCATQATDYASSLAALEGSVLNYPDYLVFDIDPYIYSGKEPKGAEPELNRKGFATGKRVAFWLRDLLRQMSLEPIVKTSGKTGLHVFVPIERIVNFDEARLICETVGRHLMREHPREITMEWAVVKRTGKIFMDYNMNVRGKTLNVAYSPRGAPGAPVSMPLSWEELEAAEPTHFSIRNVMTRLNKTGDRWQDALLKKQSLTRAFASHERR